MPKVKAKVEPKVEKPVVKAGKAKTKRIIREDGEEIMVTKYPNGETTESVL
jgi:hypothetical protein